MKDLERHLARIKSAVEAVEKDNTEKNRKDAVHLMLQLLVPVVTGGDSRIIYDKESQRVDFINRSGAVYSSVSVNMDNEMGFLRDVISNL